MEILIVIAFILLFVLAARNASVTGGTKHKTSARAGAARRECPTAGADQKQSSPASKCWKQVSVEHVIDGDTVVVADFRTRFTIRLDSIDCPEYDQHWGDTAKFGLIKLIGGRNVFIEAHGTDGYGRMLATIYLHHAPGAEPLNVNERMVTLGHAWVMRRYYGHLPEPRQKRLNRLERWARSNKVGLWRTPRPVPPWHWRNSE